MSLWCVLWAKDLKIDHSIFFCFFAFLQFMFCFGIPLGAGCVLCSTMDDLLPFNVFMHSGF